MSDAGDIVGVLAASVVVDGVEEGGAPPLEAPPSPPTPATLNEDVPSSEPPPALLEGTSTEAVPPARPPSPILIPSRAPLARDHHFASSDLAEMMASLNKQDLRLLHLDPPPPPPPRPSGVGEEMVVGVGGESLLHVSDVSSGTRLSPSPLTQRGRGRGVAQSASSVGPPMLPSPAPALGVSFDGVTGTTTTNSNTIAQVLDFAEQDAPEAVPAAAPAAARLALVPVPPSAEDAAALASTDAELEQLVAAFYAASGGLDVASPPASPRGPSMPSLDEIAASFQEEEERGYSVPPSSPLIPSPSSL